MIVVEGPDGAGKTTLVNEICREFGLMKGARNPEMTRPQGARDRVYNALAVAVAGESCRVHDRLFWSEVIYGPILRGESKFTLKEEYRIMGLFKALQCPVIFVRRPWKDTLEELHKNPPQLDGWTVNRAELIWERYIEAGEAAVGKGLNALTYDPFDRNYLTRTQVYVDLPSIKQAVGQYLLNRREWTV